jgi:hypothetical protein
MAQGHKSMILSYAGGSDFLIRFILLCYLLGFSALTTIQVLAQKIQAINVSETQVRRQEAFFTNSGPITGDGP